jgi:hypothetical protein
MFKRDRERWGGVEMEEENKDFTAELQAII